MFIPISRAFCSSKHDQPAHQLLNCQRLLQPIDELFMILLRLHLNYWKETFHIDLIAASPLYHEYVRHGCHF